MHMMSADRLRCVLEQATIHPSRDWISGRFVWTIAIWSGGWDQWPALTSDDVEERRCSDRTSNHDDSNGHAQHFHGHH